MNENLGKKSPINAYKTRGIIIEIVPLIQTTKYS